MRTILEETPADRVELDLCESCDGVWFDKSELEAVLGVRNLSAFSRESPLLTGREASFSCPRGCDALTLARHLATHAASDAVTVNQCPLCEGIWLPGSERNRLVPQIHEERAEAFVGQNPDRARMGVGTWLFMFMTGLPVEQWNPLRKRVVLTPLLVAICFLVFLGQISSENGLMQFALVPAQLATHPLTAFTHMFLHGGWLHLVSNMYFLWVFGDNVEDRLGRGRFLALYLLSGLVAGLTHAALSQNPTEPMVGASGAIAGVMAAYAVLYPRTRLISLILFWRVRWRAWVYLGMWLAIQLFGIFSSNVHVAFWAHIGGFAVGLAFAWRYRPRPLPALTPNSAS